MYRFIAACFVLLSAGIIHAQTLTAPSSSSGTQVNIQECASCSTDVALSNQPHRVERTSLDNELPSAPSATAALQPDPVVWSLTERKEPDVAPRPDPVWDKKMWAAHLVLAGSMIFDVETTHQGLAHHQCYEGNDSLRQAPSRAELYKDNLLQFVPVVFMDWLGAASGRAAHLPRWAWKSIGYIGPTYGSAVHIRGAISWYTNCW